MHNKIILVVFLFFIFLYTFSLPPVFSTGDAGGLIVASFNLGIAHPPGYPLYSEIGKLFSFTPVGNIGFRAGLISAVFSVLTLYMLWRILFYLTGKKIYSVIGGLVLGISYTFFFQATMIKFYPLNAFLMLLLFYIALKVIKEEFDRKYAFLSAFILGLMTGLHHTGVFMIVPLFVIGLFYRKEFLKIIQ